MRRTGLGIWGAGLAASGAFGCGGSLSDFASFLGDPFGDITDQVRDLDEPQLEDLMSVLMLRFRSYLALREAIPFESLDAEECFLESRDTGEAFSFVADANCVFGADFDPADGTIGVTQQQLAVSPVGVFRFELDYREAALLGRPLTSDEVQQFTHHVRRITSILALSGELDGHYAASV